ncbi:eclosion hormone [Sitodiplosis mosellana]|uniref:eclosion hormone n=1 Tax=Sitodiplosis mosellana TaxID=263140 RepID=UPI0024450486|nr:eclosion hormone [Sitodiplosis mosellana]
MFGKIGAIMCIVFVALALADWSLANPVIESGGDFDLVGICLRNCAQCKKMYGSYFEGQMCADGCVKFKGKVIPDCEDIGSIAPFLNKF